MLIESFAAKLATGEPPRAIEGQRCAAVAVLLHDIANSPRVLLMKRAERVSDPWSGHISLPGGRYELADRDLLATAIRETHEELSIDLHGARYLGHLPSMHPMKSGPTGIQVTPFVFATEVAVVPTPSAEALAAFWLPLDTAASGALDGTYAYPSSTMTFPSWNYEGYVIWGLTWRILGDLIELAKR